MLSGQAQLETIFDQLCLDPIKCDSYLTLLQNRAVPLLRNLYPDKRDLQIPVNIQFLEDETLPYFHINVRHYLWIGRGGSIEEPTRSTDLTFLGFFLKGPVHDIVYMTNPQDFR